MALKTLTISEFDLMLGVEPEIAISEVTEIVFPTKTQISDADYFWLHSTTTDYYVWFDVSGTASDPTPGGTGIKIDISSASIESSYDVAEAAVTAINGGVFTAVLLGADRISISNAVAGRVDPASDFNSGVFIFKKVTGHGDEARYIFPQSSTGLTLSENHFNYVKNTLGGGIHFKALDSELLEDAIPANPKVLGFMLVADSTVYETNVLALLDAQKIT